MSNRNKTLISGIFLIFIFIIAFFIRAQETISGNFLFLLDSGRDMMAVKSIVFDHKLTLIGPYTSLGGVFQGPLYYYLLSIPTAIFNGNPWGNILLMLILSLSVLGVTFYFMNKNFGLIAAIIAFVLFAFSPEAIAAATYFWNPHPMWVILVLYIFILYGAIEKNKLMQIMLLPIVTLSFHFEMAFGVFLLLATIIYILLFQRKKIFISKYFWIGVLVSFVFFLPQIIFDLRHDFLMTRSVIEIFNGSNRGLITSGEQHGFIPILNNNYNVFITNLASSFPYTKEFKNFPLFILLITFFSLILLFLANGFSKKEKDFIKAIGSIIVIVFIICLFYPFPLRYWFLTGFQSFYLVLIALILSKTLKFNIGKVLLTCLLLILLIYGYNRINILYFNPLDEGGAAKIKGKIQAIDYIYQDAKNNKNFGVIIFTPPVLTDAYDYLIWWYGGRKYGYIPHEEKKGTVYLLIEPSPGNPWTYKGWLETVIKTGEIIQTKTFPDNELIVQKRKFSD